jgi:L-arabinose isomerase
MEIQKIGLLPLYLELYDNLFPEMRNRLDTFLRKIEDLFSTHGVDVQTAPICRLEHEVQESISRFENTNADAVVTIHLAYSPSLESAASLAKTKLPVIILDTTPAFSYGARQDPGELMFNHGIHGVQDLCNLLLRHEKPFLIHAGHWERSDVMKRLVHSLDSAKMACAIRRSKIGLIGDPFSGMGDFSVPFDALKEQLDVNVLRLTGREMADYLAGVSEQEVSNARADICGFADTDSVDEEVLDKTIKTDLALQKWFAANDLTGVTFNFQYITREKGLPTVPFFTAGKAMASGMGYAGEGDCLTAALVGALLQVYPKTSFTEMFCPDWENGTVYLSHMGEVNYTLLAEKPRFQEMNYSFSDTGNPAFIPGRFKEGEIVITNLAPVKDGFRLITVPAQMIGIEGEDRMMDSVHGWFQPQIPLPGFLEAYSELGGTHHLALSYDADIGVLRNFARLMNWEFFVID